jgi:hypothetical protein
MLFVIALITAPRYGWNGSVYYSVNIMIWSLPGNILGDLVSWCSSLWLLKRLRTSPPLLAIALIAFAMILLYIVVLWAIFSQTVVEEVWRSWRNWNYKSTPVDQIGILFIELDRSWFIKNLPFSLLYPFGLRRFSTNWIAIIQVTLPIVLFFAVAVIGLLIYACRPLRGPLMFLLEKIEASPNSILTLAAAVLSAIAALLAAWAKAASS